MSRLAPVLLVIAVAACGGKPASSTSPGNGGAAPSPARLPWEAALTTGATFTLQDDTGEGDEAGEPLVIKVTAVEDHGAERVYRLDWGPAGTGPSRIVVRDGVVLLGDATPEDMQEPFENPMGTCYGEDFSNPDGCDDVCDANLCLSTDGIVSVDGLYAPGYGAYLAR